jgi:hypothetical protein
MCKLSKIQAQQKSLPSQIEMGEMRRWKRDKPMQPKKRFHNVRCVLCGGNHHSQINPIHSTRGNTGSNDKRKYLRSHKYRARNTSEKQTPWPESVSELYRPSDRRLPVKLVPTFAVRGVSRSQSGGFPTPVISTFWTGDATFSFQVAHQLYLRGWVDPVLDSILPRKSGSAGNRTSGLWICSQKLWPLDHRGGHICTN